MHRLLPKIREITRAAGVPVSVDLTVFRASHEKGKLKRPGEARLVIVGKTNEETQQKLKREIKKAINLIWPTKRKETVLLEKPYPFPKMLDYFAITILRNLSEKQVKATRTALRKNPSVTRAGECIEINPTRFHDILQFVSNYRRIFDSNERHLDGFFENGARPPVVILSRTERLRLQKGIKTAIRVPVQEDYLGNRDKVALIRELKKTPRGVYYKIKQK